MFKLTFKGSIQRLGHNSCGPNEWKCKETGSCISIDSLCNMRSDCGGDDQSDENNCGRMFNGNWRNIILTALKYVMTSKFSNFCVSYVTDCSVDQYPYYINPIMQNQNTPSDECPSESPICSYGTCKGKHMFFY